MRERHGRRPTQGYSPGKHETRSTRSQTRVRPRRVDAKASACCTCGNIEISIVSRQLVLEPRVTSALARARPTSRHRTISTRLDTGRRSSILLVTSDGTLSDISTGRGQPLTPDYLSSLLLYVRNRYAPSVLPKRTLLNFDASADRGSRSVTHVAPKACICRCGRRKSMEPVQYKGYRKLATLP